MRIELTPAATCVSARGQRPNRVLGTAAVCTHQTWACFEAFACAALQHTQRSRTNSAVTEAFKMADKFAVLPPALAETRPPASKLDLSTSAACASSEERPQRLVLESWRSQDSQCHCRLRNPNPMDLVFPRVRHPWSRAQSGNQDAPSWKARIEAVVRLAIVTRSYVLQRRRCPHPHCAKVPLGLVRTTLITIGAAAASGVCWIFSGA